MGEDNPHGDHPALALYHLPRRASGDRLRRIMGLHDSTYAALDKVNLCRRRWLAGEAETMAARLRRLYATCVLLGAKVRKAFGGPPPFTATVTGDNLLISLPHPSGLCREWNKPGAVLMARALLSAHLPDVPWGEIG